MKKVAFLINRMDAVGGTERVVANLSTVFKAELDLDITVITMTGKESYLPLYSGIHFYTMQNISLFKKGFALRKYMKDQNIDTLISVGMMRLNVWLAFMLPLLRGVKVIATEHTNANVSSSLKRFLKIGLFRFFDYLVLLTKSNTHFYKKWGFNNVVTIHNINSFESVKFRDYNLRSKLILSIGRLSNEKNFIHLLMAWNKIFKKYPDWKLHIVGEGNKKDEMMAYIESNEMEECCMILPFTNNVHKHYSEAQIFVLSSLFEGLPMVLLEAQQYGIPCVSYDCETGPRDIIVDGENGFLVKNQSPRDLAEKLSLLIENDKLRCSFHKKSLFYSQRFSKENICHQWKNIL